MGWIIKTQIFTYYPFNKVLIIHSQSNHIVIGKYEPIYLPNYVCYR